ncbi:MAG: transcriptional regulator [Candidatus Solibacter sp.]|nr:transcriptional regulator [Candidatus Solibacter sp.]
MTHKEPGPLSEIDRLIHEPARLLIVAILSEVKEADYLYIQQETGLTKGNLSSHLDKLEKAGYIEIEKAFRGKIPLTILRIARRGSVAFKAYRNQMGALLNGR